MLMSTRRQAGDTIIEVLIVLAVLSTAFAIAYGTATRGLSAARQAQEHSEALQFLSSEIELIKAEPSTSTIYTTPKSFCISSSAVTPLTNYTVAPSADVDATNVSKYPAACYRGNDVEGNGKGLYRLGVTYQAPTVTNPGRSQFVLYVRWDGPNGRGQQQESIVYKQYKPTAP